MQIEQLPLSKLRPRFDARPLNKGSIPGLMESIKELGIISPLRVRPVKIPNGREEFDGWEITAGRHRFEAAWELNLETVPCIVATDDDLRAELAMIDENLCRAELGEMDRARQSARRKAIYLILHPKAAPGAVAGFRGNQHTSPNEVNSQFDNLPPSFGEAQAAITGQSVPGVYRDTSRGENISDLAANLVRGTRLDKGTYLDKLKKVPQEEQLAKVEKDLDNLELATARADKASKEAEQDRKSAEKITKETGRVIALSDAEQFGEWLMAQADLSELPMIISWLEGTKAKDVIACLRRKSA